MPHTTKRNGAFAHRYLKRNAIGMAGLIPGFILLWIDRGQFSGFDFWAAVASFVIGIAHFAYQ